MAEEESIGFAFLDRFGFERCTSTSSSSSDSSLDSAIATKTLSEDEATLCSGPLTSSPSPSLTEGFKTEGETSANTVGSGTAPALDFEALVLSPSGVNIIVPCFSLQHISNRMPSATDATFPTVPSFLSATYTMSLVTPLTSVDTPPISDFSDTCESPPIGGRSPTNTSPRFSTAIMLTLLPPSSTASMLTLLSNAVLLSDISSSTTLFAAYNPLLQAACSISSSKDNMRRSLLSGTRLSDRYIEEPLF